MVADFDEWKRHRKVIAPAFSEVRNCSRMQRHFEGMLIDSSQKNNKLAFEESLTVITSLYEGDWNGKHEVVIDDTLSLTMAVSSTTQFPTGRKFL